MTPNRSRPTPPCLDVIERDGPPDEGPMAVVDGASERDLLSRAATIGLLMRHSVTVGVAGVTLLSEHSRLPTTGNLLLTAIGAWSVYRLATRSDGRAALRFDVAATIAVCAAIPVLVVDGPRFFLSNSAPQAIAGTAVISVAFAAPMRLSVPATIAIAIAYACGSATLLGWSGVVSVPAIYYFVLQWLTSGAIRLTLRRVAAAVDVAREGREAAEARQRIEVAVRDFDREQLALLHDTVASTLLMVGQGVHLPPSQLASQARRDLDVLGAAPAVPDAADRDLVAGLREIAAHVRTPVFVSGEQRLFVKGDVAAAVIAACREALNNVDRHARADRSRIEVKPGSVTVLDDGVGFDVDSTRGHGLTESISARMDRIAGTADVVSAPGRGTQVRLLWPEEDRAEESPSSADLDALIARVRVLYATALSVYAVVNVAVTAPFALHTDALGLSLVMIAVAVATPVVGLVAARSPVPRAAVALCLTALLGVVLVNPLTMAAPDVGTHVDWVQAAAGWCALPPVLSLSVRRGAAVLMGLWVTGGVLEIVLRPDTAVAITNVGLGTGSILGVQLFALAFDGLVRSAAERVHTDVEIRKDIIVARRITETVAADYRRRYAGLIDAVVPLLREFADGGTVDSGQRRRAMAESRRLRTLFAQSHASEPGVIGELRAVAENAQRRGLDVIVDVAGKVPQPSDIAITDLIKAVQRVLTDWTAESARIAVSGNRFGLTISVLRRGLPDAAALADDLGTRPGARITVDGECLWMVVDLNVAGDPKNDQASEHDFRHNRGHRRP